VVIPGIKAWMKQGRKLSGCGIYRSDITAFEPVADGATEGEILLHRLAAMLDCDHAINLVFR
jgi:hypothetical protein